MTMRMTNCVSLAAWCGCFASLAVGPSTVGQTASAAESQRKENISPLAFTATDKGECSFDTGILRGKLRADGKSLGLSSVVHIPSGAALSGAYGIFGHYRVFVTNKRFGTAASDWPSTARLLEDGAVEVSWPAAKDRPFELRAIYRWHDPSTLDLETVVKAQEELPHFESFLASYFNEAFMNSIVFVRENPETPGKPGFLAAKKSFGDWLMFPRDAGAVKLIKDGRWTIDPHPVDWAIMPEFSKPLGIRRDPKTGITAVLMAPRDDCFALSTPHQAEGHYSLYMSLFGGTIRSGEVARARARLWIAQNPSDQDILDAYRAYLGELRQGGGVTTPTPKPGR